MSGKRSWTADLKVVTPPVDVDNAKPFTLILPYYENPEFLLVQLDNLNKYAESGGFDVYGLLSLIIVDDGSRVRPINTVAIDLHKELRHKVRAFRIDQDVRWNWLAARNIAFDRVRFGWCLVTDMDHVVPHETIDSCISRQHDPEKIYAFSRKEHTGEEIGVHPNSWFMTREMFWRVGGYDEALSGHYGTDGDWRRRMAKVAEIQVLTDYLIRHEYQGDSSTTTYKRKQPQDAAVSRIIKARKPGWKPKVLSFPYHEVQL